MLDKIDLFILFPSNACISCACDTLQVKPYNNLSFSSPGKQDLVYNDIIGLFLPAIHETQYVISFLNDDTKKSKVCFLKQKSEILQVFRNYLAQNKREDHQNYCLHINGDGKYDSNKWTIFWEEKLSYKSQQFP